MQDLYVLNSIVLLFVLHYWYSQGLCHANMQQVSQGFHTGRIDLSLWDHTHLGDRGNTACLLPDQPNSQIPLQARGIWPGPHLSSSIVLIGDPPNSMSSPQKYLFQTTQHLTSPEEGLCFF